MSFHQQNKSLVLDYFRGMENANVDTVEKLIESYVGEDYHWYGVHPFGEQFSAAGVAGAFLSSSP